MLFCFVSRAEGGIEMTMSREIVRECARAFSPSGRAASKTRVLFPDKNELKRAVQESYADAPFRLGYLTDPNPLLEVFINTDRAVRYAPSNHVSKACV